MENKGWMLLLGSFATGLLGFFALTNFEFETIGAVCGFMIPSIVYFGNRIK